MPNQRSAAIVLEVMDYGESDKIVTCYTLAAGKLKGIAKGAKRSRKRFVNKLELFSRLELYYVGKAHHLARIEQADLRDSFPNLRFDFRRYNAACLLCELVLHWTRENDADPELFQLLHWGLKSLNQGEELAKTIIYFHLQLLTLLGYRPQLGGCLRCGQLSREAGPFSFNLSQGGIICRHCHPGESSHLALHLGTIKLLLLSQDLSPEKFKRFHFSPQARAETLRLLRYSGNFLLQRELHSWRFLHHD